jgi:hypothetical protein
MPYITEDQMKSAVNTLLDVYGVNVSDLIWAHKDSRSVTNEYKIWELYISNDMRSKFNIPSGAFSLTFHGVRKESYGRGETHEYPPCAFFCDVNGVIFSFDSKVICTTATTVESFTRDIVQYLNPKQVQPAPRHNASPPIQPAPPLNHAPSDMSQTNEILLRIVDALHTIADKIQRDK